MSNNIALLQSMEETIKKTNPGLMAQLNEGLSQPEIDRIAASCQLDFNSDINDLFSWKNGIDQTNKISADQLLLFPNGIPLTLRDAADQYDIISVTKHLFEPNYFPLFHDQKNSLLLIDLDPDSPTYSMLSLYAPDLLGNSAPMTIYDFFSTLLETAIQGYNGRGI